jgi:arylsulfatase A-like enzyme
MLAWNLCQLAKSRKPAVLTPVLLCLIALGVFSPARADSVPPNVVFIVLDTARGDRVSFNGYDRVTTPNLERLARDSVTYTRAHSVAPWTLPSHMSMFTGLLPSEHGATWRAFSEPDDMQLKDILSRSFSLSDPAQLLTVQLKQLGYRTAAFSSNAWVAARTGFGEGFDDFYEMWQQDDDYREVFKWTPPGLRERDFVPDEYNTLSEMDTGDAGLVLRELKQHQQEQDRARAPFFMFFNFIDPHYPYSPPMSWRYLYGDDRGLGERIAHFEFNELAMQSGDQSVDVTRFSPFYDAEINYVDTAVGRLLEQMRAQGEYDDALIIVTSDHGEHLGEGGRFSHQFSMEEELLHVPLLVKYPGNVRRGTEVDNPLVSTLDVYETILAAAEPGRRVRPATTRSRNLADPDNFSRTHLIAEYDYSLPYLRVNQAINPEFSVAEHSVVRRVVYDML